MVKVMIEPPEEQMMWDSNPHRHSPVSRKRSLMGLDMLFTTIWVTRGPQRWHPAIRIVGAHGYIEGSEVAAICNRNKACNPLSSMSVASEGMGQSVPTLRVTSYRS